MPFTLRKETVFFFKFNVWLSLMQYQLSSVSICDVVAIAADSGCNRK